MPQSLVQNYLHIVFSTKNLSPLITPEYENELFGYMAGISKKLESPSIKIGGHLNHIHILCSLSKNISLVEYCKNVKSYSSKWKTTFKEEYVGLLKKYDIDYNSEYLW